MSLPKLSIIMVNYNGSAFIQECLDSLFASQCTFEYQVLFVDNCSTDDSLAKITPYTSQLELIKNKENVGFATANNQCLPLCKGELVLLLNTDTVLSKESLQTMVDFMDKTPKAGALSPKLLNTDGSVQVQGSFIGSWRYHAKKTTKIPFICGACLLTRKSILNDIGGLDANLFFYNDDIDFCKQLSKRKWPIYYLPSTSVIHHGGLSSKQSKKTSMVAGYKGSLYLCKKFYGLPIYYAYRVLIFIEVSVKLVIFVIKQGLGFKPSLMVKAAYLDILAYVLKPNGKEIVNG